MRVYSVKNVTELYGNRKELEIRLERKYEIKLEIEKKKQNKRRINREKN